MDTIIYFSYTCREMPAKQPDCTYILREWLLRDYRLIKIQVKELIPRETCFNESKSVVYRLMERWRKHHRERQIGQRRMEMEENLKQELAPLLQEYSDNFICYDASVPAESWIRDLLPIPEFAFWSDYLWVKRLLPKGIGPDIVVLGEALCLEQILWELSPYMKSVLWIVSDGSKEEQLEAFAEDFYQETGLAIRLQYLPPGATYAGFTVPENMIRQKVDVLDFTKGKYPPRFYPPKGSKWFDMEADEEKARRICARGLSCELFSLRKQWKNL